MPKVIVTYRKTSRLSMRIGAKGEVRVSAPLGMAKEEVVRFVEEHDEWITNALQRKKESLNKRYDFFSQLPLSTQKDCNEAVARMNAIIPPLVEKYSRIMGVNPTFVEYKATISRWGCCQKDKGKIQFSVYLLLLPDWCIEHVVVHELAHLIEPNHSKRFYALMDRFFPRWKEARETTKHISRMDLD